MKPHKQERKLIIMGNSQAKKFIIMGNSTDAYF